MNRYIKCTHCSHDNLLKTEYMVFCSNCNKKLENNFQDWHKLHPSKSFEDYQKEEGISESLIEKNRNTDIENQQYRKSRKHLLIAILALIATLVVASILLFNYLAGKF